MRSPTAITIITLCFLSSLCNTQENSNQNENQFNRFAIKKSEPYVESGSANAYAIGRENNNNNNDIGQRNPPSNIKTKKRRKKDIEREKHLENLKEILLKLRTQLKTEGIEVDFMDKALTSETRIKARIAERLIKKAKKKIAKAAKKKHRTRTKKNKLKGITGTNLLFGMKTRKFKSLSGGAYGVRGSLNPCPAGQTRRRGRCRCPYLSEWHESEKKCACIYGTYKDARGNCKSYI